MTFDEYLANRLKLAGAAASPDKIDARLLELHRLEKRDGGQQRDYEVLLKATRAKFKAAELERKAKASLEKKEESDRKSDAHAKILIGMAAIELSKQNPGMKKLLARMAGAMPSARKDLIDCLLGSEPSEAADLAAKEVSNSGEPVSMPLYKQEAA